MFNLSINNIMENTILKAYAKLNLSLNLLPELGERGYYNVQFINTQISLSDTVNISKLKQKSILINVPEITRDKNIAYRAARLLFDSCRLPGGISINILKKIPLRAGLGGGSCDAACVINGLEKLFDLNLARDRKLLFAKELGMDVCYCIIGGLCRIGGVGDVVQRLQYKMPVLNLLIATPNIKKPSTAWAYSVVNERDIGKNAEKIEQLIDAIRKRDIELIASNMHNDFEKPIQRYYPVTEEIKETMLKNGALNTLLAGSGLSVFGIFKDMEYIFKAKSNLEKRGFDCYIAQTIDN